MKKRMKKVATLCLAGVTAMSTVGVTGSAVFAKGDTNYDVDNMDFENVELRVAFRFNNGSDTDGQAKWYYKALDEFNKENEGKIHVTDESISTESDYEEKLTTDFASGNVPNAFLQYGGSRTREYVDAGYILDLTPYFKKLVECVSKGGNMILNVGPDAKGKFPKESSAILAEIGRWMDKNHDSIYGCVPAENIPKPDYGRITRNGNKYYVHIYENTLGPLPLLGFDKDKIVKVRALDDGHEVPISNAWMHSDYPDIAFVDLGPDPVLPDPVDYVLEVEMAE